MKIELTGTDKLVDLVFPDGQVVPARVWEGKTASGIPCHAYITRLCVHREGDEAMFERELMDMHPPKSPVVAALPRKHKVGWFTPD